MIVNQFGEKYYKLGLHLHTTLSDGRKTPNEVAKVCRYTHSTLYEASTSIVMVLLRKVYFSC
jgi:hypothetical protein